MLADDLLRQQALPAPSVSSVEERLFLLLILTKTAQIYPLQQVSVVYRDKAQVDHIVTNYLHNGGDKKEVMDTKQKVPWLAPVH